MESKEFTLMQKLIDCANNNSVDDVFGALAYYLLLNFPKIETMSTSMVASACFTSTSTVRRFCNSIGYESFSSLRSAKAGNTEDQKQIAIYNARKGRFSAKYMQEQINESLYATARSVDREVMDPLVDTILHKQSLLLMAIRPYALWLKEFQSQMLFIGKPTYIIDDLENYGSLLKSIRESYSCIVVSPTGGIAGTIADQIGSLECEKTLVISSSYARDSAIKPLLACYDQIIELKIPSNDINYLELFGKYGISYLFDLLFGKVIDKLFLRPRDQRT